MFIHNQCSHCTTYNNYALFRHIIKANTKITFDDNNKRAASITSDMLHDTDKDNEASKAAVGALEAIILAHFCAGIDITTPDYLEGIETAYLEIINRIADATD
ncbi:hypothetical protein BM526_19205 (plasmid) [Alteromonas mediterranea]|uniref:hypothetical protein n=1 Tax=Alteromonas mediterranea TaxID=314275 RepID=UPI0009034148|nr:hypothetical protein [Alteromonas mediterranea]APE04098.1 hypothetical protein BM526_19205 [Alteromonas mediterranea]